MNDQTALRGHLLELLEGSSAHIDIENALDGFPLSIINERPGNSPHSPWQLLEHIRIAQWDILDFCRNPDYKELKWPDEYWPAKEGTEQSWTNSVKQVMTDLETLRTIVRSDTDLFAAIEHGRGKTKLREVLLVAEHNAYHLGQLVLLRRMYEASSLQESE